MKLNFNVLCASCLGCLIIGFIIGQYSATSHGNDPNIQKGDSIAGISTDNESITSFKPLSVEDLGVDSITVSRIYVEGPGTFLSFKPGHAEAYVERGIWNDTTMNVSPHDQDVILRAIDSLYISKTSKPYVKIIDVGMESSASPASVDVTIYRNGQRYMYDIYPANTFGLGKGHIFSQPCYDLLNTISYISIDGENRPYEIHPTPRIQRNSREDLMHIVYDLYYPDTVPIEVLKRF